MALTLKTYVWPRTRLRVALLTPSTTYAVRPELVTLKAVACSGNATSTTEVRRMPASVFTGTSVSCCGRGGAVGFAKARHLDGPRVSGIPFSSRFSRGNHTVRVSTQCHLCSAGSPTISPVKGSVQVGNRGFAIEDARIRQQPVWEIA